MRSVWSLIRVEVAAVMIVGLAIACASMSVHDETMPGADLASLSAFAWQGGQVVTEELIEGARSGLEPMIEEVLLEALVARGYRRDSEAPDFAVSFLLSIEQEVFQTTLQDFGDPPRGRLGGGGRREVRHEFPYEAGTLTIELQDAEKGTLLWRGWAEAAVEPEATPQARRERIREAVSRILDRLPAHAAR